MLPTASLLCALFLGSIAFVAADASSGFIRVSGTQFVDHDCRPFIYSGWNRYETSVLETLVAKCVLPSVGS